jgi:hypothetical protein
MNVGQHGASSARDRDGLVGPRGPACPRERLLAVGHPSLSPRALPSRASHILRSFLGSGVRPDQPRFCFVLFCFGAFSVGWAGFSVCGVVWVSSAFVCLRALGLGLWRSSAFGHSCLVVSWGLGGPSGVDFGLSPILKSFVLNRHLPATAVRPGSFLPSLLLSS